MSSGIADDDDDGEKPGRFSINGLEIDLDELDAFECRLAQKRGQRQPPSPPAEADAESSSGVDYLDEYLERLQVQDKDEEREDKSSPPVTSIVPLTSSANGPEPIRRYTFLQLLLVFMSLVSMAKLLKFKLDGN